MAQQRGGGVAIAIDRDKNSQSALKWAAENLLKKTDRHCVLLHVRCQAIHPNDSDFVPKGGRAPTEAELKQFFLPFRGFCARKGIVAKEVVLHDIDVPSALVYYVTTNSIVNLVVGASNRNMIMRKIKSPDVATALMKTVPQYCSVYAIVKDRVHTVRPAKHSLTSMTTDAGPDAAATKKPSGWSAQTISPDTYDITRSSSSLSSSDSDFSLKSYNDNTQNNIDNDNRNWKMKPSPAKTLESFLTLNSSSSASTSEYSRPYSFQSSNSGGSAGSYSFISENSVASLSGTASARKMDDEMAKLQFEFQQSLSVYNMACQDLADAEKANESQRKHSAEIRDLEDEDAPKDTWSSPRPEKYMAKPPLKRLPIELQAQPSFENQERQRLAMSRLGEHECRKLGASIRKYSIKDIERATGHFSDSRKIGEGGYGPVYVGALDELLVAIKVLRPDVSQGLRQFQQEVEVLGGMKHPNMVHLVGACPEYGCLVYEYMDYGSLEDRLFCKDDTPPIPWRTRFKIAADIAMGLLFLHQTKPEPLVHRDIKPSNILLDKNYRCKIGDVGLARLVPASVANKVTQYHLTAAAGTFCYIDPEYQQTGMLGCKSDVYSFGVVLLQILTSKAPMGLALRVEDSIEEGTFRDILDPEITDWPYEESECLAKLALKCCELRRRDRPDLASVVLPVLNRIKNLGLGLDGNADENATKF